MIKQAGLSAYKNRHIVFIAVFLFFTHPASCQTDAEIHFRTFTGADYKFAYPASWTLDTTKTIAPALFAFSPLENDADKFRENVNVIIQDLKGKNMNLKMYKQLTEEQIRDLATDGKIFESSIMNVGKEEFYKIVYSMVQGKFKLKMLAYCYIRGEQAYLITFTSEFEKYEVYKDLAGKILDSFTVTNKERGR